MPIPSLVDEIRRMCQLEIFDPKPHPTALIQQRHYQVIHTSESAYFLKTAPVAKPDVCATEALALQELASASIKTPGVICTGCNPCYSFLLLEYVNLNNQYNQQALAQLAVNLHSTQRTFYGWQHNNYIGKSFQPNEPSDNWSEFWLHQRLLPQHHAAKLNQASQNLLRESLTLQSISQELLQNHQPNPVLLHGDFWTGNVATLDNGTAITFDPAMYYGDRETDIAMSELFTGFNSSFYQHYDHRLPLAEEYRIRKHLYNSYHLLNHVNCFGEHVYGNQLIELVKRLAKLL